jgi:hypothetical protein
MKLKKLKNEKEKFVNIENLQKKWDCIRFV